MIRARNFERALRDAARAVLRQDRSLWKEYKVHRARRRLDTNSAGRGVAFLYGLGLIGVLVSRSTETLILMLAAYSTGTVFVRAARLQERLHASPERFVFLHYPLSDETYVRMQLRSVLLWSLLLLAGLLFAFGGAAWGRQVPWWAVMLCAVAQWAFLLTATCWFAGAFPRAGALPGYGIYLALIVVPTIMELRPIPFHWSLVSPAGWIPGGFGVVFLEGASSGWFFLAAGGLVACLLPFAYRRTVQSYSSRDDEVISLDAAEGEALSQGDTELDAEQRGVRERFLADRAAATAGADDSFAAPRAEENGWIESVVFRYVLKGRDRTVAEFLLASKPDAWSKKWLVSAGVSAVACASTLVFQRGWTAVIGIAFIFLVATPLLGGRWPGFDKAWSSAQLFPVLAVYPVTFEEISRVLLKVHTSRILLTAPLLIAPALVLGRLYSVPLIASVYYSLHVLAFFLAIQPAYVVLRLSACTTDGRGYKEGMLLFAVMVAGGLLVCLMVPFVAPFPLALIFDLIALLFATGWWWMYAVYYRRGRLDLLTSPESQ